MIYELRIYYMFPGRMDAINKRFSGVTLGLFKKHGIKVVDFWEDAEGNNKLYYVLEYESVEDREKRFGAFVNDPDWIKAKEASEKDSPIVEKVEKFYMKRVSYI